MLDDEPLRGDTPLRRAPIYADHVDDSKAPLNIAVTGASGRLFCVGERTFAVAGDVELAISRIDDGATLFMRPVTVDGRQVTVAAMRNGLFAGEPAAVAQLSFRDEGSTRVRSGSSFGPGYLRPSLVEDFFAGRDVSPPLRAGSAR